MSNVVLKLQNLKKSFPMAGGQLEILKDVNLAVNKGEVVALIGRSGSGKTTLLQLAGLLSTASSGGIELAGKDVSKASEQERTLWRREQIGFVYQFHHLLPEFTALENIAMPLIVSGVEKSKSMAKAEKLLAELGLSARGAHRPSQLSGGEQQRVSIARALANDPALLLADEPTGNLDDASAALVFDLLMQMVRQRGMAALIATHNLELAAKVTRSVRLEGGKLI